VKDILHELNETISSRGALVVAQDGMLIAADVREGVDVERLSALGAAILDEIGRALNSSGYEKFSQIEIATEQGKVILVEAGATYLFVLLGARLEIGPGSIEIQSAANRIARETEFASSEG
jgi:predicted regulator of Ras-like GTPase activity (Roadblock/LC7/MglB family)